MNLTDKERAAVFEFLEIATGSDTFACLICASITWTARKTVLDEKQTHGRETELRMYVQLTCQRCRQVLWFHDSVLDLTWKDRSRVADGLQ